MKFLYPNLHRFFAGYFHQDCFADSANAIDVVKSYRGEATADEVDAAVNELRGLLAGTPAEDDLASIVHHLGSYYNPRAEGLSYRDWLRQVCTLLEHRSL